MANATSQHILNTSANLLGFCFFVLTSLHLSNQSELSNIYKLTSVIAILLSLSCILSFASIRVSAAELERKLETAAEYLFLAALVAILFDILLISYNFLF